MNTVTCPLCDGEKLETYEYEEHILDANDEETGKTRIVTATRPCGLCRGTGDIAEEDLPHYRTGDWEEHPSWGVAMFNHATVSGDGLRLFDSEIGHNRIVTLTVQYASRRRDHHRDHIMEAHKPRILELEMSMSQFGALVSSFGTSGVPVTIALRDGQFVEREEPEMGRLELTAQEVLQKTRTAVAPIAQAYKAVENAVENNAGKRAVKEALKDLRAQIQNMPANAKFAADSLAEHAETVVTKARADIEAMVTMHAEHLGLERGDVPDVKLLGGGK